MTDRPESDDLTGVPEPTVPKPNVLRARTSAVCNSVPKPTAAKSAAKASAARSTARRAATPTPPDAITTGTVVGRGFDDVEVDVLNLSQGGIDTVTATHV